MSNVIRGYYQQSEPEPYVIDNENSEIGRVLNERIMKAATSSNSGGFSAGLDAEEIDSLELEDYEDIPESYVEDPELARQAAQVMEDAYNEAAEIKNQALAEIEDAKERARLEGLEQGYQEGIKKAEDEIDSLKAKLLLEQEEFVENNTKELEQAISDLEPKFADILCDLLNRLTGVVVTGHKDVIMYLINNAIRNIDNCHEFVVSLSEEDYQYVDKNKDKIYGYLNPSTKIELFQDSNLSKNQCKIETENGLVDLSLDVQLNEMIKALMLINS